LGLGPDMLVRLAAITLALAFALALLRLNRPGTRLALGALLAAFLAFETGYVLVRFARPTTTLPSSSAPLRRDWIDASVPSGSNVALVPNPYHGSVYWWDAEFWNTSVDRTLRLGDSPTFTPFPTDPILIDSRTGKLHTPLRARFLVVDSSESRFGLVGQTVLASSGALDLVGAERPFRVQWAVSGTYPDGWLRVGRSARVDIYPDGRADRTTLTLVFSSPPEPATALGVVVETGANSRALSVKGSRPATLAVELCAPRDRPAALLIQATGAARITDGRAVGPHLDSVAVHPTGRPCQQR